VFDETAPAQGVKSSVQFTAPHAFGDMDLLTIDPMKLTSDIRSEFWDLENGM
jgi:hypothetical protein